MLLIKNIKFLLQIDDPIHASGRVRGKDMHQIPMLEKAWILLDEDRIHSYGAMADIPTGIDAAIIDASGKIVMPSWCDSHTHLVFAAPRESEFVDKILGKSYAEIAAKGGGILNSARKLQETSEDTLFELAKERLRKVILMGTGAIEIKSGYGLTTDSEIKMLRVIQRLKALNWIPIKSTFLGAHALPQAYKEDKQGYLDLVIEEMLPAIVQEGLADYIDVFCEDGFFDRADTARIIEAGKKYGLKAKIHANQLNLSGGVQVGVDNGALSVDHLETMTQAEVDYLQQGNTIPTLLPGAAFFLRMSYPPARDLIQANLPVAVASDFNPGSCPSGNMNLMLSLACVQMRMTPHEAIHAQTINGAAAMELESEVGTIQVGKRANLIITEKVPSVEYLAYSYGENLIDTVIVNGKIYE